MHNAESPVDFAVAPALPSATLHAPTRDELMAQLQQVVEPCSVSMGNQMSICEMGLVEDVSFADGIASVVLCLTDPSCINFGKISQYVRDVLMELPSVRQVEITHTTEVLWTPDRIAAPPRQKPG